MLRRRLDRMLLALVVTASGMLAVAWLLRSQSAAVTWLAAGVAGTCSVMCLAGYYQDSALWWLPACAGILLGLAAALLSSHYWPGSRLELTLGLLSAGAGIGWAAAVPVRVTPGFVLAFAAGCLFAAAALLLGGLGYRLWLLSLVLLALAYDLAVTFLFLPSKWLCGIAVLAAAAAVFLAPQPAASLRLLLPLLLVVGGLVLLKASRDLPDEADNPTAITQPRV